MNMMLTCLVGGDGGDGGGDGGGGGNGGGGGDGGDDGGVERGDDRRMPPNVCAQAVSPVKGCAIVYQLYGDTQKAMIFTPIRTQEMSPRAF
jgi:hypothetical protein